MLASCLENLHLQPLVILVKEDEWIQHVYALHISACRQTISPFQFPMSPVAIDIIRCAEELARKDVNNRLETKYLVMSLMINRGKINSVLADAKITDASVDSIVESVQSDCSSDQGSPLRPTINYRRVIEDARIIVGDADLKNVDEIHLLYTVLFSKSSSVDHILEALGSSRSDYKIAFDRRFTWTEDIVQTFYEP